MCGWRKRPATESRSFSTTFIVEGPKLTCNLQRRSLPMARNALGRGLGALIREPERGPLQDLDQANATPTAGDADAQSDAQAPLSRHSPAAPAGSGAAAAPVRAHAQQQTVAIDLIEPSPYQPRTQFREEALAELAQSIRISG